MVMVGNQGLDDRYRISHPAVSGLRQSHSITFQFRDQNRTMYSNVRLDILKFSFHHSSTKFPFNRVSTRIGFSATTTHV